MDANVFIRHFTQDQPDQSRRATAYVEMIGLNRAHARTSEATVAEIIYVLASSKIYRIPRAEVVARLRPILEFAALQVPNKPSVLRALDLWTETNVDFEDALNVAHMERLGVETIVSFDRHYDRLPQVTRREP